MAKPFVKVTYKETAFIYVCFMFCSPPTQHMLLTYFTISLLQHMPSQYVSVWVKMSDMIYVYVDCGYIHECCLDLFYINDSLKFWYKRLWMSSATVCMSSAFLCMLSATFLCHMQCLLYVVCMYVICHIQWTHLIYCILLCTFVSSKSRLPFKTIFFYLVAVMFWAFGPFVQTHPFGIKTRIIKTV